MGDRIVVMKDGLIQQVDTPQNLYDNPCNRFVAGFIGTPQMNFLSGTLQRDSSGYSVKIDDSSVTLEPAKVNDRLPSYVGREIKFGIRPEDIYDDEAFIAAHSENVISATVEVRESMGSEVYLYLNYHGVHLTAKVAPTTKSQSGKQARLAIDRRKIHLFDPETEAAILN
jgi:multiple sugar transport system ATP-binding protein